MLSDNERFCSGYFFAFNQVKTKEMTTVKEIWMPDYSLVFVLYSRQCHLEFRIVKNTPLRIVLLTLF